MKSERQSVTIVVPGDLHLTDRAQVNFSDSVQLLKEVNDLIRPDFVQFIGDNVQDATDDQFQLFHELRGSLSIPDFTLVGDHDVVHDPSGTAYRRWVGEPYGALRLRGFRFLRLNTLDIPRLGLSDEQLAWLNAEFAAARADDDKVVLFQHHYPYKVCEQFDGPGIDQWRELVAFYRPVAIVCGHTHYGQIANDGRNLALTVRSIGDPEGGAPGYLVIHLEKNDFAITYRTIDDTGPLMLITHPRDLALATDERHIVHADDVIRVRIWSYSRVLSVRAAIDGGPAFELSPSDDGAWAGPIDISRLRKGEHVLKVVARQSDEQSCEAQLSFFVDGTRRFTAVPSATPTVRTTAFC